MRALALLDPRPGPLWPLGFLQALEEGQSAFDVLTLYLGAGAYHLGTEGHSDEDLEDTGSVLGHLRGFPRFVLGPDPSAPRLGLPRYTVDVDDPLGELAALLTAEQAEKGVLRVPVVGRLGAEGESALNWPAVWTGVLSGPGAWSSLDANAVRLNLAQDGAWLLDPVLPDLIDARFPHARADARGLAVPRAVGTFDSRASSMPGAIPCLYVDTRSSEWRFLVVGGRAAAVPRVWADGVAQVEGADYDLLFETFRGVNGTWIQFTSDPGADVDVRCDLVGLESAGDGTGTPWETPALQLRALLDEADVLDELTLAEVDDALTGHRRRPRLLGAPNSWTHGRRPARYVSRAMRKLDLLNEWTDRHLVHPYWNEAGKVAFALLPNHRDRVAYRDASHWIRDEDLFEPPVQYELRPGPRRRLEAGQLAAEDRQSAFLEAEALAPNPWATEQLSELDLVPYVTTADDGWTFTGGADFPEVVADPSYTPDSRYASWAMGTGTFRVRARASSAPQIPQGHRIGLVEVRYRARGAGTIQGGVYDGSPTYGPADTPGGSFVDFVVPFLTNPSTSAPWEVDELGPDALELAFSATGAIDIRAVRLRVYTADGGPAAALTRERLARGLLLYGRRVPVLETKVRLTKAAIRPGDAFSVSTPQVVAPGLEGWETEIWQRRRHVMCSRTLLLEEKAVLLRALDGHELQVPLWESGLAENLAPEARGIVRLGSWEAGLGRALDGRQFSRITADDGDPIGQATITAPWGDSALVEADHEKFVPAGLAMEAASGSGPVLSGDRLVYRFLHDAQPWPIRGGTAFFLFTYGLGTYLFSCGSDLLRIDSGVLEFLRTVDAPHSATINLTAEGIVGGIVAVAIRWTPGEGGLEGLDEDGNEAPVAPYTLDLWARQGVTLVRAPSVVAVEGFAGDLDLGSLEGTGQGHTFKRWEATPRLLTDDEVEAHLEQLLA